MDAHRRIESGPEDESLQPGDDSPSGLQKTERALYALLELSKALGSEVGLDDLLRVIVENASSVVDAERTSIFLFDASRDVLWSKVAQGLGSATIELPIGTGIAGDVARTLRPANIPDAYDDPRFNPEFDRRNAFRTRAILASPVLDSAGKLLGVIQSVNKRNGTRFDPADALMMAAIASHVAVAIERAQMTEAHVENERFAEALRVARDIQLRMLPRIIGGDDAPFELHADIRPAKQVGGDLYDFVWDDGRLYFCIGDVSGKGVGAALIMALTKTLMRAHVTYHDDPAQLMAGVNTRLYEQTDPSMFVTALCGFLDLKSGRVRYANAGHDRPLLLRSDGSVFVLEERPGIALGVLPQFGYRVCETTLAPGDTLLLYTDGITEAQNGAEEEFTFVRLRAVLERSGGHSPRALIETILGDIDRFVLQAPQSDDLTMLCIRYRGGAEVRTDPHSAAESPEISGVFARDIGALEDVFRLVERFFARSRVENGLRYPVQFVLEEIFTNLVKYNAAGNADIRIDLGVQGNEVMMKITDGDSPRFDITADAREVDVTAPLDAREPGGLGIHLVKKMVDRIDYTHENRTGVLTLYKRIT